MAARRMWAIWGVVTLLTVPVSFILWWVGGTAMCGEEVYNPPPGSAGDSLCDALVKPGAPSAALAAIPTLLAAARGFATLRLASRRMFVISPTAPFLFALGCLQVL